MTSAVIPLAHVALVMKKKAPLFEQLVGQTPSSAGAVMFEGETGGAGELTA